MIYNNKDTIEGINNFIKQTIGYIHLWINNSVIKCPVEIMILLCQIHPLYLGILLSTLLLLLQMANIICRILILIRSDENSSRHMLVQVRERILSLLALCHTDDPICVCYGQLLSPLLLVYLNTTVSKSDVCPSLGTLDWLWCIHLHLNAWCIFRPLSLLTTSWKYRSVHPFSSLTTTI